MVDTRGDGAGHVTSQVTYTWAYDADDRLTGETLTVQSGSGPDVPPAYADGYAYDLDNNRVAKAVDGGAGQTGGSTVAYTYDGDDQLRTETGTGALAYQTTSTYDADGNLKTQVTTGDNAESDSYGYDLQNEMTSATVNSVATAYTYDADGVLASESTAGGTATYDLNDPNNPTGYSKAVQQSGTPAGPPTTSYVLGLGVEAQSKATHGTLYLLVDGHGSTRALADTAGAVVSAQTFDYDAFGTTLTNAATADTVWRFGGDGAVDHATGWTYHLARWREGDVFTQRDASGLGQNTSPVELNEYTYANGNPVNGWDPTGDLNVPFLGGSWTWRASDHQGTNISQSKATALGLNSTDLGPHLDGPGGQKYYPTTQVVRDANGNYDAAPKSMNKAWEEVAAQPRLRARLVAAGLTGALLIVGLLLNEYTGKNQELVDQIKNDLLPKLQGHGYAESVLSAALITQDVQTLFVSEIGGDMLLGSLLNAYSNNTTAEQNQADSIQNTGDTSLPFAWALHPIASLFV